MWNRDANVPGTIGARTMQDKAAIKHRQCEAPTTCPCQHMTGQFIKP